MKVIISGGGTGGHIFPAIAIANALKELDASVEILFVGAKDRMEMEKVPAAGYKIEGLWISGLQRRLTLKNLLFPFKVISSMMRARKIIKEFKPNVAVGTGGFASGPLLRAAAGMGVPTLIQEQNAFPGITNKLLSKKVNKICVVHQGMDRFFPKNKILIVGNPVRKDILTLDGKKEEALKFFNLNANTKIVLVIGGSLGARTINESIHASLEELKTKGIQLIWQTGKGFSGNNTPLAKEYGWRGEFITKMDLAYAAADVVVSRAGALSLSELAIVKKPCILVPSPNVAEDHQTKNAKSFVDAHAAIMVKDSDAKIELSKEIIKLVSDINLQHKLSSNIVAFAFPKAAETIAKEVMQLGNLNA